MIRWTIDDGSARMESKKPPKRDSGDTPCDRRREARRTQEKERDRDETSTRNGRPVSHFSLPPARHYLVSSFFHLKLTPLATLRYSRPPVVRSLISHRRMARKVLQAPAKGSRDVPARKAKEVKPAEKKEKKQAAPKKAAKVLL